MKNGKRPTRRQKQILNSAGLQCDNWLVVKNLPNELNIVHRMSGKPRKIQH